MGVVAVGEVRAVKSMNPDAAEAFMSRSDFMHMASHGRFAYARFLMRTSIDVSDPARLSRDSESSVTCPDAEAQGVGTRVEKERLLVPGVPGTVFVPYRIVNIKIENLNYTLKLTTHQYRAHNLRAFIITPYVQYLVALP